jgi:lipid-A-disaccharide synthase
MNKNKKIMIITGEESGDMYASNIINALSKKNNFTFYGMGSYKMKKTSAKILVDSSELSVVGIFEILKIYPKLLKALKIIKGYIRSIKPDLIILIDYQEFNIKLAKFAKQNGIKVLFYIGPQIWAWREKRINKIKNYVDEMAVIFPFETKYYKKYGISSHYVGHPLVAENLYQKNYKNNIKHIGFFPGSRLNEVKKHLPIILNVIEKLHIEYPNEKFIISRSSNINIDIYNKIFFNKDYISIISNENIYKTIDMCRVAIAASGTITLQIALKKVPMCIFYKLSILSYFLAKFLVKIKFISLVNIVLEKNAIKEFIQNEASSTNIFNEVKNIVSNDKYKNKLITDISLIEKKLLDNKYKFNINDLIENMLK